MVRLKILLDQPRSATLCADGSQSRLWLKNIGCLLWKEYGDDEVEVNKE